MARKAFLSNGKAVLDNDFVIGDIIAGNMILTDGVIIRRDSMADESSLTGEAMPVKKKKNDRATNGSLMQDGYLEIEIDTDIAENTIKKTSPGGGRRPNRQGREFKDGRQGRFILYSRCDYICCLVYSDRRGSH
jgi:magnesium-transporting ATPase (P-type)